MRDYVHGKLCGVLVYTRWILGQFIDDPEAEPGAKELGIYFEFITFGTLPKDGKIPQPQFMKSAIKSNKGSTIGLGVEDMYEPYRLAHRNSEILLQYLADLGFLRVASGKRVSKTTDDGTLYEGVIDLEVECQWDLFFEGIHLKKGQHICIDVKYSGLTKDTTPHSNKHGWKWSDTQKVYHGTQAKQYHFLTGLEVFFLVMSSTNEGECKLFHAPVTEWLLEQHILEGNDYLSKAKMWGATSSFEARPALLTCNKCPLRGKCDQKHTYPHAITVNLTTE